MCTGLDWRTPSCDVDENSHILFYLTSLILNRNDWILTRFTLHQSRSEYQSRSTTRLRRKQTSSVHLLLTRQIVSVVTSNGDKIFYQLSLTDVQYWMLITCTFTVVDRRLQQPRNHNPDMHAVDRPVRLTPSLDLMSTCVTIITTLSSLHKVHLLRICRLDPNDNSTRIVLVPSSSSWRRYSPTQTSWLRFVRTLFLTYHRINLIQCLHGNTSAHVEDSREVIPVTHNVIICDPDCSFLIILTTDVYPIPYDPGVHDNSSKLIIPNMRAILLQ